ncbi:MAG: type VI secretion system-associated protein TagF [Bacteroidetes bacterium]|nr:type VI secretion system-associated protein TagF [Bacteroidota bacterium]
MLKVTDTNLVTTGYFGKLPKFADFVKYNASGDEILLIDNWIQEGIRLAKLKYKNNWRNYYNNTSPIYFIFPFTGTNKITIGIICPSKDKSGRNFPFLIFGNMKQDLIKDLQVNLLPLNFKGYFESITELYNDNYFTEDLSEMKFQINNLSDSIISANSAENIYDNYLSDTSVEKLYQKTLNISDYSKVRSVNNLFKNRIEIIEHSPAVKFNFDSRTDYKLLDTCFHIQLLLKIFNRSNFFPAVFWNTIHEELINLFLFFQKPTPLNFLDLINTDDESRNDTTLQKAEEDNQTQDLSSIFKENLTINYSHSLREFLNSFNT